MIKQDRSSSRHQNQGNQKLTFGSRLDCVHINMENYLYWFTFIERKSAFNAIKSPLRTSSSMKPVTSPLCDKTGDLSVKNSFTVLFSIHNHCSRKIIPSVCRELILSGRWSRYHKARSQLVLSALSTTLLWVRLPDFQLVVSRKKGYMCWWDPQGDVGCTGVSSYTQQWSPLWKHSKNF